MKHILTLLVAMLPLLPCWSQPAGLKTARTVAGSFYKMQQKQKSAHTLQLYATDQAIFHQKAEDATVRYYIFNDDTNGFVIVSGDRRCQPILGYSTQGGFDTAGMPENIRWWLQCYRNEIAALPEPGTGSIPENPLWELCGNGGEFPAPPSSATSVEPLVQTKWGQGTPYNDSCPYDANASGASYNYHTPVGCVATAMAQVLYFWKYPTRGKGYHTYTSANYGTIQSANFEKTTYDWNNMTTTYSKNSSAVAIRAVAQLMYHCGVSVEMNYGTKSSGAYCILTDEQKRSYKLTDARDALQYHFGCDTVIGYKRDNFSDSTVWISMLKKELNARHPILYGGANTNGGHAFVCDGYDNRDFFHINWGWNGSSDGYFQISALDPSSQGIGGSNSGYNLNQSALFVHPVDYPASTLYNLNLYKPMHISSPVVKYNTAFSISDSIANIDTVPFNGQVGVAIYNENGTFFGVFGIKKTQIKNGYYIPNFKCDIAATEKLTGGNYTARMVYADSNDRRWHPVGEYYCTNSLSFRISGGYFNYKLKLYSPLHVQDTVEYNSPFQFVDSIANIGTDPFEGKMGIGIYDSASNYKGAFGITDVSLTNGYFRRVLFNVEASEKLTEGLYSARIVYKSDVDNNWYLIGSEDYNNYCSFRIVRTPKPKYTLSVIAEDSTMGCVSEGCEFYGDTTVTISATPFIGYHFSHWKDGIKESERMVSVYSDTTFIAIFEADEDGIAGHEAEQLCIYAGQREIIVKNAEGQPLQLFDLTGRLLGSIEAIAHAEQHLPVQAPGVYIVRIGNDRMRKIVIY